MSTVQHEPIRKPLAASESRDPKSIRFSPAEWAAFVEAARLRGKEASVLVRDLAFMGLMVAESPALMEAYLQHLSVIRAASLQKGA